jgi:hypothetical protein
MYTYVVHKSSNFDIRSVEAITTTQRLSITDSINCQAL